MTRTRLIPARVPEDIPADMTEEEARAFWDSDEITEAYLRQAEPVPSDSLPPSIPITRSAGRRE